MTTGKKDNKARRRIKPPEEKKDGNVKAEKWGPKASGGRFGVRSGKKVPNTRKREKNLEPLCPCDQRNGHKKPRLRTTAR